MTDQLSLLYTTFPHEEEAITIIQQLLEESLIACANILGPIKSFYFFKGALQADQEVAVLFKTTSEKAPSVIKRIENLHSYEIPAILEIPIKHASTAFVQWVQEEAR